jgi:hypothetical protein
MGHALILLAVVRRAMRVLLDVIVMHAGNVVERHPGSKHLPHDAMLLPRVLVDIEEVLRAQDDN